MNEDYEHDGNEKVLEKASLQEASAGDQGPSQSRVLQKGEFEKSSMEAERRGYSDLLRTSTEEIFLRSLMEGSMGMTAPTMEMLGFKKISQSLRADSEELFNSWLTNGEIPGHGSTSITNHTQQASHRLSNELVSLLSQQNGIACQTRGSDDVSFQQNPSAPDETSNDLNQYSFRNALEKGLQASNLYLGKEWFQSTQPMTRSRSSELRRRYAAMQNIQASKSMIDQHNMSGQDINKPQQEFAAGSCLSVTPVGDVHNQMQIFPSPSNSYTSPVGTPPITTVDAVSSVVSMLKDTLERKKHNSHSEKQIVGSSSFHFYNDQEVSVGMVCDQGLVNQILDPSGTCATVCSAQLNNFDDIRTMGGPIKLDIEDLVVPTNQMQMGSMSQEPSQSESSAAAPVLSTGFEVCDGPTHSGQALTTFEHTGRLTANGNSESGSKAKELRERIFDSSFKDDRKKRHLIRVGSLPSGGSVDKGDPTKKRRVERSRKMAEAKERNSSPTIPSDMQSVLRRCENLEKEVRSLKLNLSFMNRKDSEQTKQIEELQKQNEELTEEKERLLEEIERIITESGKI